MRKLITSSTLTRLIFLLAIISLAFGGCKKVDDSPEGSSINDQISVAQKINTWLDKQKKNARNNCLEINANIDFLKANLDIADARKEQLDSNQNLLIIPIKNEVIVKHKLDKTSTLTLFLLIDNTGKIKDGGINYFLPSDGIKHNKLPENTFTNMFNYKPVALNGKYRMLTITGRWLSQIEIREGKLFRMGNIQQGTDSQKSQKTNGCIDWYLVTTYHFADGSTETTKEYVGTTCDCNGIEYQSFCPPDEGGGVEEEPEIIENNAETFSFNRSSFAPSSNFDGSFTSEPLIYNFRARVAFTWSNRIGFYNVVGYQPYVVPTSQTFVDDHGDLATVYYSTTYSNQFNWVYLTPTSFMATWMFVHWKHFKYLYGTMGPFSFNETCSAVVSK